MGSMKWYEDPVYIKMCVKAEKIQALAPNKTGDWFVKLLSVELEVGVFIEDESYIFQVKQIPNTVGLAKDRTIWLPTQAQLQAMVDLSQYPCCSGMIFLTSSLYKFHSEKWDYSSQFTSMEQLWLAFVMKERYGKVWTGTNWEKAGGK